MRVCRKDFDKLELTQSKLYDFFYFVTDEVLVSEASFDKSLQAFKLLLLLNNYFNKIVKLN